MALELDTRSVLAKLAEFGHDYTPQKQAYKASIAGDRCALYDPQGARVTVDAASVEQHLAKAGWSVDPKPAPELDADGNPIPAGEPDLSTLTKSEVTDILLSRGVSIPPGLTLDELVALSKGDYVPASGEGDGAPAKASKSK